MSNLSYSLTMLTCNVWQKNRKAKEVAENFYDLLTVDTVLSKTRKKGLFNWD